MTATCTSIPLFYKPLLGETYRQVLFCARIPSLPSYPCRLRTVSNSGRPRPRHTPSFPPGCNTQVTTLQGFSTEFQGHCDPNSESELCYLHGSCAKGCRHPLTIL